MTNLDGRQKSILNTFSQRVKETQLLPPGVADWVGSELELGGLWPPRGGRLPEENKPRAKGAPMPCVHLEPAGQVFCLHELKTTHGFGAQQFYCECDFLGSALLLYRVRKFIPGQ